MTAPAQTPPSETPSRPLLTWTRLNLWLPLAFGIASTLFAGLLKLCSAVMDGQFVFTLIELPTTVVLLISIFVLNFRVCKSQAPGNPILYLVLVLGSTLIGGSLVFAGCGLSLGVSSSR